MVAASVAVSIGGGGGPGTGLLFGVCIAVDALKPCEAESPVATTTDVMRAKTFVSEPFIAAYRRQGIRRLGAQRTWRNKNVRTSATNVKRNL